MLAFQKQNFGQKRIDDENPHRIIGNDKSSVQKYEDTHAKLRGHVTELDQKELHRLQNLIYGQINLSRLSTILQTVSEDLKKRDKWYKQQAFDKVSNYQD